MENAKRNARKAGLAYLSLAIAGIIGYLIVRSQLLVMGDAAATTMNLIEREGLARLGIAADLTMVLAQALAALYFFKLFRGVNSFAAGSLAAFGFMNAVAGLVWTAFSATALQRALDGAAADTVLLLYELNGATWAVGALFFGMWLIPMGWLTLHSGFMPRALGWILMAGGVGYALSAYATHLLPDASMLANVLTAPATVGEFWMLGYLLIIGVGAGAGARTATADQPLSG